MGRLRAPTLIAAILVMAAPLAQAGDITLTRSGDLYRVEPTDIGLMLSHPLRDGSGTIRRIVPQTAAIEASSIHLGVDEASGAVIVVWQQGGSDDGTVRLAVHKDGTWIGPIVLAGLGGTATINPEMLIHRVTTVIEDEDGTLSEVSTTFVHLSWWGHPDTSEHGSAVYAALPLDAEGLPELDRFDPFVLSDLMPWGIGCHGVDDTSHLAHPMLFVDPQTGDPHIMASEFGNCLFQIVQLHPVFEPDEDSAKRGRHIIIFARDVVIGINPMFDLAKATIEAGHDLSVVLYWDRENAIDYAHLEEGGWSEVKTLPIDDNLSHERAVQLIRSLAR